MKITNLIFALAAVLTSLGLATPVLAEKPDMQGKEMVTIVIDTSDQCYMGKIADFYRNKAERRARDKKRELEAQGKQVRIVRKEGTIAYHNGRSPAIHMPGC